MTGTKRILVVDDTKDVLMVVSRRLQSWGYEALTADSGEEGLRVAEEQVPDLILPRPRQHRPLM